ncbi:hypothetical protein [Streptomyces olivaceus]|nr:hypothetical protein [Streptomyces olivaceus]MBZ6310025.1 hypothetical protein [Streptomyces olivaceus]MBZ6323879.1 hypothetical protein [Streptomyces olivaceus]
MPTTTMLDQATAMIENAWGQPIEALEVLGRVRKVVGSLGCSWCVVMS